ncbi:hypothetical protein ABES02_28585 [Neobacillus pocheonensis]|uniref:hypothetical protein n=1 Tax=Neobacillus pocheonensis TaxID=363869 RepID=UPI003D2BCF6E
MYDDFHPRQDTGFERELSMEAPELSYDFPFDVDDFCRPIEIEETHCETPTEQITGRSGCCGRRWRGKRFVTKVTASGIVVDQMTKRDGSTADVHGCTWGVYDKKLESFLEWDTPHKREAVSYAIELNKDLSN